MIYAHGLSGLPVYSVWQAMHRRCYHPQDPNFPYYGGRGIRVCERWNDLANFLADMGHPPEGMSIGRIDNDGPYETSNCRWETQEQQNENTRRNRYVTWDGRTQTIKAWAQELDMEPRRISERLSRGWSAERTMTTPCPKGYARGREEHLARCKETWARWGRHYTEAARARREGRGPRRLAEVSVPEPITNSKPAPAKRSGRCTPEVQQQILDLSTQGLTCRAIAERVPVGKSTVATVIRAAAYPD